MTLAKLLTAVAAATLLIIAQNGIAAEDKAADTKTEKSEKAEPKKASPKKKVKPHSHMEEKTNMPAATPEKKGDVKAPSHDHRKEKN